MITVQRLHRISVNRAKTPLALNFSWGGAGGWVKTPRRRFAAIPAHLHSYRMFQDVTRTPLPKSVAVTRSELHEEAFIFGGD